MIENKPDSFEIDDENLAVLSSGLNSEQLAAVKKTENVVVSAGAGSGKTTVLASRYAYLVEAKNVPCEKILTLTFTKKAANEMKERIFYGLRNHFNGRDIKGKKQLKENFPHLEEIKERAKTAVERFDRTYIQTLDSYFSEIAKKGSRYYGVMPNFTLDDEKINSKVNFMATKYVLENLEKDEIKQIAEIFQIQNVARELFANPVLKYSTVLTPIAFEGSLEKQKIALIEGYENLTSGIKAAFQDFIDSDFNQKRLDSNSKKLKNYHTFLYEYIDENGNPQAPVLTEKFFESEESIKSFLDNQFFDYCHTVSEIFGSKFSKAQCWRVGEYKLLQAALLPLLEKLYLIANSLSGFFLEKKIFAHLSRFQEEVNRTKRTGGFLSFSDVSLLAVTILSERAEIRHIEQAKFDAIMIDEFQDDNQLQCDVLLILSDKKEKYVDGKYILPKLSDPDLLERLDTHKLFFVGDDKQSIYRFRGADVSVFRNLSSSVSESLDLKTNYRSSCELIAGFNTIFGGYGYPVAEDSEKLIELQKFQKALDSLQPKVDTASQAVFMTKAKFPEKILPDGTTTERIPVYEADYKKVSTPSFRISEASFSEKQVTFAFYPKGDEETEEGGEQPQETQTNGNSSESGDDRKSYEYEASYIASEIKKLLDLKTTDKDGNVVQKYHYRDIALLFRTSSPTADYENVLLEAGIPYSTEVYKGFFSDGPVNDILSLLKLCVYPEDKNAYAKLLRSPFCSLTFAELEKVLLNTKEPFKKPFSEEMLEALKEDSGLYEKVMSLKKKYDEIKAMLSTEKLTKTISYIWYDLGYRYETMWNESVAMHASSYDILFEMARLSEEKTQSLAGFIDMVKSYEESDAKLDGLDVVMDAEDAVQILTVHKSKGLEFKVVFVCAASAVPKKFGVNDGVTEESGYCLRTPSWRKAVKAAEKLSKDFQKQFTDKNYFLVKNDEENERQESAELRRLAYVAFTRAEEKLYIVGNSKGEFNDEVEGERKCRRYELHTPDQTKFTWTKRFEEDKKTGELIALDEPKDIVEDYSSPKSIYQLLLPVLYQGTDSPAFNFVYEKEAFAKVSLEEAGGLKKSDFIKNLSLDGVEEITEQLSPAVYIKPSKLNHDGGIGEIADGEYSGLLPASEDYALINKIVASTVLTAGNKLPDLKDDGEDEINDKEGGEPTLATPPLPADFSFADFGTIAHKYMEAAVLGKEADVGARNFSGVNNRPLPGIEMKDWKGDTLREKKIWKIREICADMAEKYKNSEIFREASSSEWVKAEYDFRGSYEGKSPDDGETYAEKLIIKGQIDLVYKNAEGSPYKYTIVDYKTNQDIKPEIYYSQLACYRTAISQMLGVSESEIRCVLYYLRFAKEVDITDRC